MYLLDYARKKGMVTIVNTNGYYLKNKIDKIAPHTDSVIVSIDAAGDLHDKMRKLPGLFDKAVKGIKSAKGKVKISINSVITAENINSIPDLIQLSDDLNVPVFIQTMVHEAGYNDHLKLTEDQEKAIYNELLYYKKKGSKLLNSESYIKKSVGQKTGEMSCSQSLYSCRG
ncbi:MAG: hypothetical protein JXR65_07815 [Bacteroidales bacterium]|nr:hypothetical protein [Bacteroidales bacterium]